MKKAKKTPGDGDHQRPRKTAEVEDKAPGETKAKRKRRKKHKIASESGDQAKTDGDIGSAGGLESVVATGVAGPQD